MKCPFRKKKTTEIEYRTSWPGEGKPESVTKTEEFCDCDVCCRAYDGGICLMMKGNR